MSMLQKYLSEKEGLTYFEGKHWFFTYKIFKKEKAMYVAHFYLEEEERRKGHDSEMSADIHRVAFENDCNFISCEVDLRHHEPERSMYALIKQGFKILRVDNNFIYLYLTLKR